MLVEIDFPQTLDSDCVTRLILLQQLKKLGLVDYSPLDDPEFVAALEGYPPLEGGEGVGPPTDAGGSTGQDVSKNFLGSGPSLGKNFSGSGESLGKDFSRGAGRVGNFTGGPMEMAEGAEISIANGVGKSISGTSKWGNVKGVGEVGEGEVVMNGKSEWGDPWGTARRWRGVWEGYNPMGSELLRKLKDLEIYRIEVRLLDRFERLVLCKVARVMEMDRRAREAYKAKWIRKVRRKRARYRRSYKRQKMKKKLESESKGEKPVQEELIREVGEVENKEIVAGDISTYGSGEWPEGTVERVREELGRLAAEVKEERSFEGVGEVPVVEMEVMRVGPNPRVIVCRYRLGDAVEVVNVWVKTNVNFKRAMRFKMTYQEGKEWKYEGVLPRRAGRW